MHTSIEKFQGQRFYNIRIAQVNATLIEECPRAAELSSPGSSGIDGLRGARKKSIHFAERLAYFRLALCLCEKLCGSVVSFV